MFRFYYFSLLLFMFLVNINAQKTYVPDDNFENALIYQGYDDVLDDSVLTANISAITQLQIGYKHIADLTGIEDFTNLQYLDCFGNSLTNIDVSKNINLKTLHCNNNQLNSLDISKNVALTYLLCFSNQISSLDLSKNSMLVELQCQANQLTNLDVSNNTKLTKIECYSNQLSNLDLSKNQDLTYLQCFGNQLTSLDVSKNTILTYLNCSSNQLIDLNISNNVALTELRCNLNQLSTLDLSNNDLLTYLVCTNNQLQELNIQNTNNANITHVDATNNPNLICIQVDDAAKANADMSPYYTSKWKKDAAAHYSNDCANSTYIPDNRFEEALIALGHDDVEDMNVLTANISGITELNLFQKGITDLTGIQDFKSLEQLRCEYNRLTTLDVSKNTALTSLDCSENQFTSLDISNNPNLTIFRCIGNQLTNLDISNNLLLEELNCRQNKLTNLDVSKHTSLTFLSISGNQFSDFDISTNTALKRFFCDNNLFSAIDISNNILLWDLHCEGNRLTDLDISKNNALTSLVCYNNQLTDLDLSENSLLTRVECNQNMLDNLNVKNGNNSSITIFKANDNPSLQCICVDNATDANAGNAPYDLWVKDATASYAENCTEETVINDANFEQALIDLGIVSETNPEGRIPTDEIALVTKLDVSGMNISDLTGIADFTGLDTLIVSDNQITYLDLTNNTNLVYVDVSNNPIVTLLITNSDIIKAASLTENVNVTNENLLAIDISGTDIASIDLTNVPNLEFFDASGSKLESLDVSNNGNLETMDLRNCTLTCIRVSQAQFDNIPAGWQKETSASYCNVATRIDEKAIENITLHPNPVSDILYIKSATPLTKIEIYSVTGEMVKVVVSDFNTINVSNLRKGLYIVRVFTEKSVIVRKLMKN